MNRFKQLLEHTVPLRDLSAVSTLVSWDQETYMPEGAAQARASQASLLSGLIHERLTGAPLEKALSRLVDLESGEIRGNHLTPLQRDAVRQLHRKYARAKRLPNAHVAAAARLYSEAQNVWVDAKRRRDFSLFEPYLRRIIDAKRREADYLGYGAHPYDALLDEYEPGAKTADVSALVDQVVPAVREIARRGAGRPLAALSRPPSPEEAARILAFCRGLVADMGFDFSKGRIDAAEHPATNSMHPSDVRLTLRRRSQGPLDDVFSALHEGGHALYEQGLDAAHWGTPVADAVSLGIHESQSRLWENVVGRDRRFWKHRLPLLAKAVPAAGKAGLDRFMQGIWTVAAGPVRLDADEVTYNLHIVLRFELEKALVSGELEAKDVPGAWSDGLHRLLGVRPRHDGEGCLQDIHWASGAVGYFPTYFLGNLYASQLYEAYQRANPRWQEDLEAGHLTVLTRWLNARVHRHGGRFSALELIRRVTGRPLSPEPFLSHLRSRYAR